MTYTKVATAAAAACSSQEDDDDDDDDCPPPHSHRRSSHIQTTEQPVRLVNRTFKSSYHQHRRLNGNTASSEAAKDQQPARDERAFSRADGGFSTVDALQRLEEDIAEMLFEYEMVISRER